MSFRHFAAAEPKRPRGELSDQGEPKKPRPSQPAKDIFTACREGDVETVRKRLDEGVDVNEGKCDSNGCIWPLEEACYNDHVEVVRLLLSRPDIDLSVGNLMGNLFDSDTVRTTSIDILRLLIDAGADVNADTSSGGSLLAGIALEAVYNDTTRTPSTNVYADMLRLFLSRPEIDVNKDAPLLTTLEGMQEMSLTSLTNTHYLVPCLFLAHPRIDVNERYGRTPLHYAVHNRMFLRRLLAYESLNPNLTGSSYHDTPLMYALRDKSVRTGRIVDLLNDARVDPNIPDNIGQTPLMYAVRKRNFAVVRHLLANVRVNLHQTMAVNALQIADNIRPKRSYEMYKLVNGEIHKRRKKQQLELARVMHRKQIEEGKGHERKAPSDVLKHIGSFLDHEMKSKLHF